jgi:ABC-2 type transport system permease protein
MITALLEKDIKLYFRNRFFALISVLALAVYLALYWLLPANAEESVSVAIFIEQGERTALYNLLDASLESTTLFASEADLMNAVNAGDYSVGLSLSATQAAAIERGEPVTLNLYVAPGTPVELRETLGEVFGYLLNWSSSAENAERFQFATTEEVLGPDLLDETISMRDRLLPMLLLLVLAMEILGLATLIAQEAHQGTARAILTTPLRLSQFFASKTILGVGLAFVQVLLMIIATGKITTSPLLLISILLVGSFMVTGIAFIVAALARDNMSTLGWGMLALIGLALPAFVVIFPAVNTGWADLIPSYFVVDSLHRTLNFGAGWADISRNLLYALTTGVIALWGGALVLRRRFQ